MSDGTQPTREQQEWLACVLGREAWEELQRKPEFNRALKSSLSRARQIGLQHLAAREKTAPRGAQMLAG